MRSAPLPPRARSRLRPRSLLWAWCGLAVTFGVGLTLPGPPALQALPVVGWLVIFAASAAITMRATLFLRAARDGRLEPTAGGRPHALWRLAPTSALAGVLVSAPALGGAALGASIGAPRASLSAGALAIAACAFWAAGRLVDRDLARAHAPRHRSFAGWLLVDTALPAGVAAALIGVAMAWTRLGHLDEIRPVTLARHLGATLLLYALLLGPAAALKVGRERLSGLVLPLEPARLPSVLMALPGPVVTGATLALATLLLGPLLLPAMSPAALLTWKAALGVGIGGLLALLGALRGVSAGQRRST